MKDSDRESIETILIGAYGLTQEQAERAIDLTIEKEGEEITLPGYDTSREPGIEEIARLIWMRWAEEI